MYRGESCIISFLYIKPQLVMLNIRPTIGCIISFLYIKPQHRADIGVLHGVVLYRFSTSNHNATSGLKLSVRLYYIVSLHQTTTVRGVSSSVLELYYIVSLHQTTTVPILSLWHFVLYYIVSLHQTTTPQCLFCLLLCCIISFLYIKPQLF